MSVEEPLNDSGLDTESLAKDMSAAALSASQAQQVNLALEELRHRLNQQRSGFACVLSFACLLYGAAIVFAGTVLQRGRLARCTTGSPHYTQIVTRDVLQKVVYGQ